MNLWARMYDRDGRPRFAVNILHVASDLIDQDTPGADDTFAHAFDTVAAEVEARYRILIGFTLDAIHGKRYRYSPDPERAGRALERTTSVLAIQGFASEVFSDLVKNGPPCGRERIGDCARHMITTSTTLNESLIGNVLPCVIG